MRDLEQVLNLSEHQLIHLYNRNSNSFYFPGEASPEASEDTPAPSLRAQLLMRNPPIFLACLSRRTSFIQLHLIRNVFLLETTEGELGEKETEFLNTLG